MTDFTTARARLCDVLDEAEASIARALKLRDAARVALEDFDAGRALVTGDPATPVITWRDLDPAA